MAFIDKFIVKGFNFNVLHKSISIFLSTQYLKIAIYSHLYPKNIGRAGIPHGLYIVNV